MIYNGVRDVEKGLEVTYFDGGFVMLPASARFVRQKCGASLLGDCSLPLYNTTLFSLENTARKFSPEATCLSWIMIR